MAAARAPPRATAFAQRAGTPGADPPERQQRNRERNLPVDVGLGHRHRRLEDEAAPQRILGVGVEAAEEVGCAVATSSSVIGRLSSTSVVPLSNMRPASNTRVLLDALRVSWRVTRAVRPSASSGSKSATAKLETDFAEL